MSTDSPTPRDVAEAEVLAAIAPLVVGLVAEAEEWTDPLAEAQPMAEASHAQRGWRVLGDGCYSRKRLPTLEQVERWWS